MLRKCVGKFKARFLLKETEEKRFNRKKTEQNRINCFGYVKKLKKSKFFACNIRRLMLQEAHSNRGCSKICKTGCNMKYPAILKFQGVA